MNKIAHAAAAALAAAASSAIAGDGGSFQDYAQVRQVDPQYDRVNAPRKECYSEYVPETRYERSGGRNLAGPVIGGVAGGLLGSRFGKGSGQVASAAAGAMIGTIVGDRLTNHTVVRQEVYEREVRRCREVDNWESRLAGYRVTYEYAGHLYNTLLPYDPGPRLAVNVAVAPDANGRSRWDR
jgi:uncharacterized protein YcfJ